MERDAGQATAPGPVLPDRQEREGAADVAVEVGGREHPNLLHPLLPADVEEAVAELERVFEAGVVVGHEDQADAVGFLLSCPAVAQLAGLSRGLGGRDGSQAGVAIRPRMPCKNLKKNIAFWWKMPVMPFLSFKRDRSNSPIRGHGKWAMI